MFVINFTTFFVDDSLMEVYNEIIMLKSENPGYEEITEKIPGESFVILDASTGSSDSRKETASTYKPRNQALPRDFVSTIFTRT